MSEAGQPTTGWPSEGRISMRIGVVVVVVVVVVVAAVGAVVVVVHL